MTRPFGNVNRRSFLAAASLSVAAGAGAAETAVAAAEPIASPKKALRVAAINSIYRLRSHAYHICGRVIHGFTKDGFHHRPELKLVRMYNDQSPKDDLGREYGKKYGVEVCDTVAAALGGPKSLDVDAVLIIIEHGDYPLNDRGQVLYPRFECSNRWSTSFGPAAAACPCLSTNIYRTTIRGRQRWCGRPRK